MPPFAVAVTVAMVFADTTEVEIVKVALMAPAPTVTDETTEALGLLEPSPTVIPSGPAAPFSVTVPVTELPPITVVGFSVSPLTAAGLMVSVAVFVELPAVAVIVTGVAQSPVRW